VFALPLAALIAAQLPLESGDGLRATLPLAGRTLIEFQARTAHAAGAGRIILLVETIPAALAQAVDRLRRDGVMIEVARSAADAADRFHVDDRILLIADGCFVEQQLVDRLVTCSASALLIVPDMAEYGLFERRRGAMGGLCADRSGRASGNGAAARRLGSDIDRIAPIGAGRGRPDRGAGPRGRGGYGNPADHRGGCHVAARRR
jgi:hypothetical protein